MVSEYVHQKTRERMLEDAHARGALRGAIQIALIDLKYNRPELALQALAAAIANDDIKKETEAAQ